MMKIINWIAYFISAIGAINWGLVAFFKFNLVDYTDKLFGRMGLDMIIYALIALAGLYTLFLLFTVKS